MKLIALDLELNQPSNKIIEIGACVFELEPFSIIEELSAIVNPEEPLNPYIIKLTSITQEMVDQGTDLQIAYGKLCMLVVKHNALTTPVVWGCGDSPCLQKQVAVGNPSPFIFGRREFDTKTLYQSYRLANNLKTQSGLSKSMAKCGINFQGVKHRAVDDARNTAIFFKFLTDKLKDK